MRVFGLAVLVALAACASPQTLRPSVTEEALADQQHQLTLYALENRRADYVRVYSIADRLRAANVELCPKRESSLGVMFESAADFPRDIRQSAREVWGMSDAPSVAWVGEGSPAETAGIRLRDVLVAVNGRPVRLGRRSGQQAFRVIRTAAKEGEVTLELRRSAQPFVVRLTPVERCGYDFLMSDDSDINAFADGDTIFLTRAMLRFTRDENELALILAHELAHNSMRHIQAAEYNQFMGALGGTALDILATAAGLNTNGALADVGGELGAMMFSQEFESEADYVGMYYLVRAGYSPDHVEEFWRRISVENPSGVTLAYTHPTHAERFLALPAARAEIAGKLANGEPLIPNMQASAAR